MPIVPSNLQPISEDVPGLGQVPAATQTAQAVARLGSAVEAGSLDLLTQIKESEAKDTSATAYYGDVQAATDYLAKLKLQSPDGYIHTNPSDPTSPRAQNPDGSERTMTQEYQQWANDRYAKNQQQLPTAMAQNLYKERSGAYFQREMVDLKGTQLEKQVEAWGTNQAQREQQVRDSLVSSPSADNAYSRADDLHQDVMSQVGRLIDGPQAQKRVQQNNAAIAESLMEGARSQVLSPIRQRQPGFDRVKLIDQWRAILLGQKVGDQMPDKRTLARQAQGLSTISTMLDPDKKAELDRAFIRMYDMARGRDASDLNALVEDTNAMLKRGQGSPSQVQVIRGLMDRAQAQNGSTFSDVDRARVEAGLMSSYVIGQTLNNPSFKLAPADGRQKIIADAFAKPLGSAQDIIKNPALGDVGGVAATHARGEVDQADREITSQSQKDFPAYLGTVDTKGVGAAQAKLDFTNPASLADKPNTIRSMIQNARASYDHMYPGQPQFWRGAALTEAASKNLAESLKNPTIGVEATTNGIRALQSAYGKHYPELMDQMIKDGNLHEGWRYAAIVPQYLSAADVVGALKDRNQKIDDLFGTMAGPTGKKDLELALSGSADLKKFLAAESSSNPNDPLGNDKAATLQEVIKDKAMNLVVQSNGQIRVDGDSGAVSQAVNALIKRNVILIDTKGPGSGPFGFLGFGSQKSPMAIPRQMGEYRIGDPEATKIQGYVNSHLDAKSLEKFNVLSPPHTIIGKDTFYNSISQTAKMTVAPNKQGLELWYQDGNSNSWQKALVPGKKGAVVPLFIPIKDVLTAPEPK